MESEWICINVLWCMKFGGAMMGSFHAERFVLCTQPRWRSDVEMDGGSAWVETRAMSCSVR